MYQYFLVLAQNIITIILSFSVCASVRVRNIYYEMKINTYGEFSIIFIIKSLSMLTLLAGCCFAYIYITLIEISIYFQNACTTT